MINEIYGFPYKCDALVDQDRYIGSDPVGYKCSRDAVNEVGGALLCEFCREIWLNEPSRLSFVRIGRYYQDKIYSEILKARKTQLDLMYKSIKSLKKRNK